ncbi:MAG: hypothetical protein QOG06_2475, partial [Gaiellaceae bacterium]|nr:hypothetical protein [Gaiellaceae bacterium]
SSSGSATVWVTRDRGSVVLHASKVPASESALQGLDRIAAVKTRFGGRYVRGVDGVSEHGRRAWFYYVNGYLADRSAADYRLRPGDVEWWDYRTWSNPLDDAVVAGAFPEPLLHGYDGHRRRTVVLSVDRALGRQVARLVGGRLAAAAPREANVVELARSARPRARVELRRPGAGSPVRFVLDARFARRLLLHPDLLRRRYSAP